MSTKPEKDIEAERLGLIAFSLQIYNLDDVFSGKAGPEVVRHYVQAAAIAIQRGEPLPEKLRDYIATALFDIGRGQDPAKALLLKKGARRKRDRVHEAKIALAVWDLVRNKGILTTTALELVSQKMHKSMEAVREIYYEHKAEIDAGHAALTGKEFSKKDP